MQNIFIQVWNNQESVLYAKGGIFMIIAVCGNIASGKTTLAHYISNNYGFSYVPHNRSELPFLKDFFEDIPGNFLQAHWQSSCM